MNPSTSGIENGNGRRATLVAIWRRIRRTAIRSRRSKSHRRKLSLTVTRSWLSWLLRWLLIRVDLWWTRIGVIRSRRLRSPWIRQRVSIPLKLELRGG
jgi:hypothetical protein